MKKGSILGLTWILGEMRGNLKEILYIGPGLISIALLKCNV
jgi:hypothetical protein